MKFRSFLLQKSYRFHLRCFYSFVEVPPPFQVDPAIEEGDLLSGPGDDLDSGENLEALISGVSWLAIMLSTDLTIVLTEFS